MKTKLLPVLAALLFASPAVFSQEEMPMEVGLTSFSDGHKTRVFGDRINVRAQPHKDAAVLDQLLIGEAVTVLATDEAEMTLNGWTANWSKIAYTKTGQRKEGYVWNGLLSPVATEKNGTVFVYNVVNATTKKTKTTHGEEYEASFLDVEIRAARSGKIVSSVSASLEIDAEYSTQVSVRDSLGLTDYETCIDFSFFFAPCGYHEYDMSCLWDGARLTLLPVLYSAGDGYGYEENEIYIFPNDEKGIAGKIMYAYEHGESTGAEGESDFVRRVRTMAWDGKIFKKPVIED